MLKLDIIEKKKKRNDFTSRVEATWSWFQILPDVTLGIEIWIIDATEVECVHVG